MKTKATLAALALMLAPAMALAEGCHGMMKPDVTASSCAQGSVWDPVKGTCVLQPSS